MVASSLLVAVLVPSCSSRSRSACGPVTRDALDPASLTHVLPGAPTPSYLTDPPTSGAHQPTPPVTGVQHEPIVPQVQVGILEAGHVIIQYHKLGTADVHAIEALASDHVIVAPAGTLPGAARVVATAWVTHQSCHSLDTAALKHFIATRQGKGPGHP